MITISNGISLVRAPLAILFWHGTPVFRCVVIFLAMVTDFLDGYLARRRQSISRLGTVLDPAMDKLFVFSALTALFVEGRLSPMAMGCMLSRDFFLFLYGMVVIATGRWNTLVFRALRWGKITTALQFIILMVLSFAIAVPWYLYGIFAVMGILAFFELFEAKEPVSV